MRDFQDVFWGVVVDGLCPNSLAVEGRARVGGGAREARTGRIEPAPLWGRFRLLPARAVELGRAACRQRIAAAASTCHSRGAVAGQHVQIIKELRLILWCLSEEWLPLWQQSWLIPYQQKMRLGKGYRPPSRFLKCTINALDTAPPCRNTARRACWTSSSDELSPYGCVLQTIPTQRPEGNATRYFPGSILQSYMPDLMM